MKTSKSKKETEKFNLEKMKYAKLKNIHLITGGKNDPDTGTGTATSRHCDKKGGVNF